MTSSVAGGGGGSAYLTAGARRARLAGLTDELEAIPAHATRRSVCVCRVWTAVKVEDGGKKWMSEGVGDEGF
ncbi:hypothetical protein L1987_27938 [Smallanthus sonchifolius]|uniref:Uncharacterized protein n=1 Tax=Smallanthus sonchifolius TaxID=185202 RepID=A0ACB9IDN9_9ASTR|nr:hypothetical protein L1987_27938 [Smallanthus sonchifolius]